MLLFYVTSALHFDYTPDSTFVTLNTLRHSNVDSLWTALLALAAVFRVDVVLAAKVFSLVFSSMAILVSYLVAVEVLNDHLLSVCAVLSVSIQAWLIQLAPTGSGVCLALVLSLTTIFFVLRNEYIVAATFAGLSALVAWQTIGLLFVLVIDAYVNSTNKRRAMKINASIAMVYAGVILPWILYSLYIGVPIVPTIEGLGIAPAFSMQVSFEILLLMGMMFVGVVFLLLRDRLALNSYFGMLLWIAIASFSHRQMFALAVPFLIIYIFYVVQRLLNSFGKKNFGYAAAVLMAALILAYNQFVSLPATQRSMDIAITQTNELRAVADWLRRNTKEDVTVTASQSCEGIVGFYSQRSIGNRNTAFLVSNENDVNGYDLVYEPEHSFMAAQSASTHYRVWRKK
jgi:hypothetical protein